jgi:hypothetical protein
MIKMLRALACALLMSPVALPAAHADGPNSAADTAPSQRRIAFGDDAKHTMLVAWQTRKAVDAPVVEYGVGAKLTLSAPARRSSYAYETGAIWEAALTGLTPGTVYTYRVGDPVGGFSEPASFRTAPDKPEDFTFTAFGDQGSTPAAEMNMTNVLIDRPAFHLLPGDLSYANGVHSRWDDYLQLNEPLTREVPFMAVPGNHENEKLPGGKRPIGYAAFLARYALPGAESYYVFDYGRARFVGVDTVHLEQKEQQAWLEETLADARRDPKVKWLIVFQHYPLYGSTRGRGDNGELIKLQQPLFDRYKVDLVICGHDHVYERQYPMRGGKAVSASLTDYRQGEGTLYVIAGGGGISLYDFVPMKPAVCAVRERAYSRLRVRVPVDGPLVAEALRLDGSLIEKFEIRPAR